MTSNIAPGIPNIPTIIAFNTLRPIWKLNKFPIKLIIKISMPPNIELPISFSIPFNGTANIFPIKNIKKIQAK